MSRVSLRPPTASRARTLARRLVPAVLAPLALTLAAPTAALASPALPELAKAAPAAPSRLVNYTSGAATVTVGRSIPLSIQAQTLTRSRWVTAPRVAVVVYFDPDGAAPRTAMRTVTTDARGWARTSFPAKRSGTWSIAVKPTARVKASSSKGRHVRVVAPPRPAAKPAPRPAPRPASTRPVGGGYNCPSWAPIKGNLSSHIYHVPGGRYYSRTKPEYCFRDVQSAVRAGFRASRA